MKLKLIILVSIILLTMTGCADHYKRTNVEGTIIEKDHDSAHWIGKTYYPEEWDITVKYKNLTEEIDVEEDEYDNLKEGDSYEITLVKGFDKKDKLVDEYLEEISK